MTVFNCPRNQRNGKYDLHHLSNTLPWLAITSSSSAKYDFKTSSKFCVLNSRVVEVKRKWARSYPPFPIVSEWKPKKRFLTFKCITEIFTSFNFDCNIGHKRNNSIVLRGKTVSSLIPIVNLMKYTSKYCFNGSLDIFFLYFTFIIIIVVHYLGSWVLVLNVSWPWLTMA